jgi:hypothetical protein
VETMLVTSDCHRAMALAVNAKRLLLAVHGHEEHSKRQKYSISSPIWLIVLLRSLMSQ